jgi:hypothetical protein
MEVDTIPWHRDASVFRQDLLYTDATAFGDMYENKPSF